MCGNVLIIISLSDIVILLFIKWSTRSLADWILTFAEVKHLINELEKKRALMIVWVSLQKKLSLRDAMTFSYSSGFISLTNF